MNLKYGDEKIMGMVNYNNDNVGYSVSFSTKKQLSVDGLEYASSCSLGLENEFYYKLSLTSSAYNASNYLATNIVFVDILPYVGDTGVILNTTARLSEYEIALASGDFIGEITSGETGEVTQTTAFKVEYASGYNPIRFDSSGNEIGEDEWDNPENIEDVKAIKVTTDETFFLESSDTFSIIFKAQTPLLGTNEEVAYNSFGMRLYLYDSDTAESHALLPTQPNKVGVTLEFEDGREQAFTDLIQSIALQQTALSHILNAEAEPVVDPNKPKREGSPLDRGEELLKSFSFR